MASAFESASAPLAKPRARHVAMGDWSVATQFAALAIYAVWVVWVALHHESWFDETQGWMLARDNTLTLLLGHFVRYEGTPGLWHAILWFAIRAGLPFSAMWLLSAACAIGGAAVIVWRAPLPLPLRLGLLTTYYYGYQYSVIARGYALDLLLVPIAAWLFAGRVERPVRYAVVVGLLSNVNAFSFLAAGLLGVELLARLVLARRWADPRALAALGLAGGLGLFALWTAWQPADNGYLTQAQRLNPVAGAFIFVANALFDRISVWSAAHQSGGDIMVGLGLSLTLLGLVVRLALAGRDWALSVALLIVLTGFASVVYAGTWHAGVLFSFVLFVVWTQWNNPVDVPTRRFLIGGLALLEIMQGIQTLRSGLQDVGGQYSAGRPAAAATSGWLKIHPGGRIAAFGGQSFEVQPWLPGNVFANYNNGMARPQFVEWQSSQPWHALPKAAEWSALLATRPDAVLAAFLQLPKPVQRDVAGAACRSGYMVNQTFAASMPWRGIPEDNTLILLERATTGPCAR